MSAPLNIVGRQPETIVIIPSKPQPWYGSIVKGDRFTVQQRMAMQRLGIDAEHVEVLAVRRRATDREMWWPLGDPVPIYEFDCPVLDRRRDGRVHVISPSGSGKLVQANGWTSAPRGKRP